MNWSNHRTYFQLHEVNVMRFSMLNVPQKVYLRVIDIFNKITIIFYIINHNEIFLKQTTNANY